MGPLVTPGGCEGPLGWAAGGGMRWVKPPAQRGPGVRGPAEPRQRPCGGAGGRGGGVRGVTHRYLQLRKETAVAENGFRTDTIPTIADTSRSPGTAAQPEGRKQRAARGQRPARPHTSGFPPSSSSQPPSLHPGLGILQSWGGPRHSQPPPPQPWAPVGCGHGDDGGDMVTMGTGSQIGAGSAQTRGGEGGPAPQTPRLWSPALRVGQTVSPLPPVPATVLPTPDATPFPCTEGPPPCPQPVPKPTLAPPRLPPQPGAEPGGPQTWTGTGDMAANPQLP